MRIRIAREVRIIDTVGKDGRDMRTGQSQERVMSISPIERWGTYPEVTPGQHSVMDLPGCPYWTPVEGTSKERLFLSLSPIPAPTW